MVAEHISSTNHPPIPWETYEAVRKQLQAANQKIRQLEQELKQEQDTKWQERKLRKKKDLKPAEKYTLDEIQRLVDSPHTHKDKEGFTRICYETVAKNTGQSDSTANRHIQAIQEQWPDIPLETKKVDEYEDGKLIRDRLYIKPKDNVNLIEAYLDTSLSEEHKRKQGGNQYTCQGILPSGEVCNSHNVMIKRRLVCLDCGHEIDLEPTFPNGKLKQNTSKTSKSNLLLSDDKASASNTQVEESDHVAKKFDESLQLDGVVLKPDTPPILQDAPPTSDELRDAQFLYLSIAGTDPTHIEMVEKENKYSTRDRSLTMDDIAAHIAGVRTFGARCWYPGGVTRAFCKDADNEADLKHLEDGTSKLIEAGFKVLVEYPPNERPAAEGWHEVSAHAWIVMDGNVNASAGWQEIYRIAPEWQELKESWPLLRTEAAGNRVRLPGGKYVMPGYREWCQLVDIETGESGRDGTQSAQLLLSHQTPASLISPHNPGPRGEKSSQPKPTPAKQETIGHAIDTQWKQKYEKEKMWFHFTDSYLIARFNEERSPVDFLPKQSNGKSFSPNGGPGADWIPSTACWSDNQPGGNGKEFYTDFSNSGRHADGTFDTGDAFEAYIKTSGKAKSQVLAELGKAMNARAKSELESAARQGHPVPGWIEEIISDHGRDYYARIRPRVAADPVQPEQERESTGGVSGFKDVPQQTPSISLETYWSIGKQHSYPAIPEIGLNEGKNEWNRWHVYNRSRLVEVVAHLEAAQ